MYTECKNCTEEIKKKYDQLNDFSNSQLKKVLIENETLKKRETALYNKIEELTKKIDFFNSVSNVVDKETYNAAINELEVLKNEFAKDSNINYKKLYEQEKKLNAYFKARFVVCNTCDDEKKEKCLMFHEDLCQGERCEEIIDLDALINKNAIVEENEKLKAANKELLIKVEALRLERDLFIESRR